MEIQVIQTREHSLAETLSRGLETATDARFAVAFVSRRGLSVIEDGLMASLESGGQAEFLFGLDFENTEPEAIGWLVDVAAQTRQQLRCLCYSHPRDAKTPVYHPKLYLLTDARRGEDMLVVGSSNLTAGGLSGNVEVNAVIVGKHSDPPLLQAWEIYRKLRNAESVFMPTRDFVAEYETIFHKAKRRRKDREQKEPTILQEEYDAFEQAQAGLPCTIHTQKELVVMALRALESTSPDGWVHLSDIYGWVRHQARLEGADFDWSTIDNSIRGRINENVTGADGDDLFERFGGLEGRSGKYRLSGKGAAYPVRPLVEEFAEDLG
jgi:HKD family nuclease